MSENLFAFSKLNDYIFCPVSIYFHELDSDTDKLTYQDSYQLNGTSVHASVDEGHYSDKKSILQGITVCSMRYGLVGKIDAFDVERGLLTERKKHISTIYDGYIFQLYAQYFGLVESGYNVNSIRLYSYDTNRIYPIPLPENDPDMLSKFEQTITKISEFTFEGFVQTSASKCQKCIYEPLCSYSLLG